MGGGHRPRTPSGTSVQAADTPLAGATRAAPRLGPRLWDAGVWRAPRGGPGAPDGPGPGAGGGRRTAGEASFRPTPRRRWRRWGTRAAALPPRPRPRGACASASGPRVASRRPAPRPRRPRRRRPEGRAQEPRGPGSVALCWAKREGQPQVHPASPAAGRLPESESLRTADTGKTVRGGGVGWRGGALQGGGGRDSGRRQLGPFSFPNIPLAIIFYSQKKKSVITSS